MPATYAIATHPGLVRETNEDSLVARPPVFMVADGMGGAEAGEVASGEVARAFEQFEPGGEPEKELKELFLHINYEIYRMAADSPGQLGMGTTATAAVIHKGSVSIAHVGDSRAYLWRRDKLQQLTDDHSLVGEMVRLGQISPAEVSSHPQRSIITRALGVEETVAVDVLDVPLEAGDLFILCSDGLHSLLSDSEIAAVLSRGGSLNDTAGSLVEEANLKGGLDNITVVLFSPDGSVPAGESSGRLSDTATMPAVSAPQEKPAVREAPGHSSTGGRRFLPSKRGSLILFLIIAAALPLIGGWFAARQIFFLGTVNGHVAVFQGLPYSIGPLDLNSLYLESPVAVDDLEPYERERLARQDLLSLGEAEKIVENYSAGVKSRQEEKRRGSGGAGTGTAASPPVTNQGGQV